MKRLLSTVMLCVGISAMALAQSGTTLSRRAAQFYDRGEWASSRAAYMTLARDNAGVPDYWVRGIVSSLMQGDSVKAREETLAAADHGMALDTVFSGVLDATISLGKGDMYEKYMLGMKASQPWMRRVADRHLLDYYVFRDDAGRIVATAQSLLEATPDNMLFLPALAYGQMLGGDLEGMAETCHRILNLDATNKDALLYLANYHYGQWKRGDKAGKDKALDYVTRASRLMRTPQIERMLSELAK